MLDQFKASYTAHRWIRRFCGALLCVFVILLATLTSGFPPWAWRLLFQVLPQLPRLWQLRGLRILAPLLGLALLSLTIFMLWICVLAACVLIARHWWRARDMSAPLEDEPSPYQSPREDPLYETTRGRVQTSVISKTSRNVRFDVQLNHAYHGLPTAPIALVDARNEQFSGSSVFLDVSTVLDTGIKRRGRPNEDSLLALPAIRNACGGLQPVGLFIVADGMGGHGNGQEASRLAIAALHDALKLALVGSPEDDNYEQILAEGAHTANLAIYRRNRQQQSNMGTTLAVVLVIGNTAYIANVGDSRVYLYRESDGLAQITRDHSTVARLVETGAITPDEVYAHPKRNEVYRSLGHQAAVKVDTFSVPLQVGDLLLLCSDGLWEMVRDSTIEHIVSSSLPDIPQICDELRQAALEGGGKDNISVIAVCARRY